MLSSRDKPPAPPGKIAIKGFSLSSKPGAKAGANTNIKKLAPPSNLGKRSRGGFGHDSDSEDDCRGRGKGTGTHEAVTGFGSEGAIARPDGGRGGEGRKELVIPTLKNRDWRGEMRNKKGSGKDLLPAEARAQREGKERGEGREKAEGVDVVNGNDGAIQWGLSVRKRVEREDGDGDAQVEGEAGSSTELENAQKAPQPQPQTADEEALASLLGASTQNQRPDLIIPTPLSEQEAYNAAVLSAPDPSTLEDYERVPVEEFGAALLRGMGWKGEKNANPKKEVKRRQNLLGLGAKELDGAEELGAWVQKSDTKRLKPGGGGGGGGERRPKASEYKREKERERERREERGGGGYRREKERDREGGGRDSGRDRQREYRR